MSNFETRGTGFNPRPPLLAGDSGATMPQPPVWWCFNPRPPLLAGDCRRLVAAGSGPLFQSTPAIAGGRLLFDYRPTADAWQFQSTPAIAGGRLPALGADNRDVAVFQSTPAIAGGRLQR